MAVIMWLGNLTLTRATVPDALIPLSQCFIEPFH